MSGRTIDKPLTVNWKPAVVNKENGPKHSLLIYWLFVKCNL